MGFFDFIFKRKRTGNDEDSKIKNLESRISELHHEQTKDYKRLVLLKSSKPSDLTWFNISFILDKERKINVFTAREFGHVKTMKELLDRRKHEEEKRIKQLKDNIHRCFETISSLLENEDVAKAETLLYQIAPTIKEVKDKTIQESFDFYANQISTIKETLRQKEIEKQRREAIERAEREEREHQERIRKADQLEKERLEKERKAREYDEKLAREEGPSKIARLKAEVTCKKENAQAFLNHLKAHGVSCFYHFTAYSNLKSIRKYGGLYSWYYCERNNIPIPNAGGDPMSRKLDRRQGLEDYVRLSFCSDHPMAFRKQQEGSTLVLLKIKIDVATFKDTQFSNVNAAANYNIHGKSLEDLQRVNISATQQHYVSRDNPIFHEHQAECMVKTFIPIEYITNIDNPSKINYSTILRQK